MLSCERAAVGLESGWRLSKTLVAVTVACCLIGLRAHAGSNLDLEDRNGSGVVGFGLELLCCLGFWTQQTRRLRSVRFFRCL